MIVPNVSDKHRQWIGSWEAAELDALGVGPGDRVIYRDHGRAELGKVVRTDGALVWARFHLGVTASACAVGDLLRARWPLDGPGSI